MARAIFSQVMVLAAFSGGSVSRASNQQTPSGWGAKFGQLQIIRYDPLLTSLLPFLLATTLFSLFWTSGSAGTSREVHCAITRATSSWTSSSYFRLHQQPWCQGALLSHRVARFPSGFVRRRFLRVCRWFHFHQKARESLALSRLRKLDPGVLVQQVRTAAAQAEQCATEALVLGVRSEGVVYTRSQGKPRTFDDAADNWRQSKFTFLGYAGAVDARPKQAMIESEVLQEPALMDSVLAARDQQVSCITCWYHSWMDLRNACWKTQAMVMGC